MKFGQYFQKLTKVGVLGVHKNFTISFDLF